MKNIKLIGADWVITCNKHFEIIKNGGILFNEDKILKIGDFKNLNSKNIESKYYDSCVITPALINPHIHFEFSANTSKLRYGSFGEWLDSVMCHREELFKKVNIKDAIKEVLKSGTSCVGAISSLGIDLNILNTSPLKVMFFNEIMGSSNIESNKELFDERLNKSLLLDNANFKTAIALHSPYSLHDELANYAIQKALENNMLVSTHFMESREELMWLTYQNGYFKNFFKKYFNNNEAKPFYTKQSFLELFKQSKVILVHCLYLENNDFEILKKLDADIVSCPRSNRLLNNKYFDFFKARDYGFKLILATDGKSSNNSLSLLDEARSAFFAYEKFNVEHLAKEIILSITARGANKLGFNNGILDKNKASDFAIFKIKDIASCTQVALNFILHAKEVQDLYINGRRIDIENY